MGTVRNNKPKIQRKYKMAKEVKTKARQRTIALPLFKQWQKLTRTGDVRELVARTGKSAPTIVNALTYGCVNSQELIDAINDFFTGRAEAEKATAKQLEAAQIN